MTEETQTEETQEAGVREIAAETMLGDLMHLVLDTVKAIPKSWEQLSENEQDMFINKIEVGTRQAIRDVVGIIAAQGMVRIPVEIIKTTIKDSVEVQVKMIHSLQVVDMVEAQNRYGMLVIANTDDFTGGEQDKPTADKDQPDLPIDGEEA